MRFAVYASALILSICSMCPVAIAAEMDTVYDGNWYRGEFWSGEYPNGFSVTASTEIAIRAEPVLQAEASIKCLLGENATYHVWNAERVIADELEFLSFTRIDEMTLDSDLTTTLFAETDQSANEIAFSKGDHWNYLAYLGEGAFLLEYQGTVYFGEQDLFEASSSRNAEGDEYHEWMKLTCANSERGWLFMEDVVDLTGVTEPNILQYGDARDLGR